jgi:hypothetical protein
MAISTCGDDRPRAILQGRKVAFDVDIHIEDRGVGHGVLRIDLHLLEAEYLALNRAAQNAIIVEGLGAEAARAQLAQPLVEGFEASQLRREGSRAVISNLAVVFMEAERRPGLGAPSQVAGEVFVGEPGETCIVGVRGCGAGLRGLGATGQEQSQQEQ